MKTKQQEQLEFIEIVSNLNQEIFDKLDNEYEYGFSYSTDGYSDSIMYGETIIWHSEMDDREWIEDKNDYEDFEPFIKKKFNDFINKLDLLKF